MGVDIKAIWRYAKGWDKLLLSSNSWWSLAHAFKKQPVDKQSYQDNVWPPWYQGLAISGHLHTKMQHLSQPLAPVDESCSARVSGQSQSTPFISFWVVAFVYLEIINHLNNTPLDVLLQSGAPKILNLGGWDPKYKPTFINTGRVLQASWQHQLDVKELSQGTKNSPLVDNCTKSTSSALD